MMPFTRKELTMCRIAAVLNVALGPGVYYYLELIQHDAAEGRGFLAPRVSWFQGQSIEFVRCKLLKDGHGRIYNSLDKEAFESQVSEPLSGEQSRKLLVWSLLNGDAQS